MLKVRQFAARRGFHYQTGLRSPFLRFFPSEYIFLAVQFSLCAGFAWAVFSSHRDRDEVLHKMLALEKDRRGSKASRSVL